MFGAVRVLLLVVALPPYASILRNRFAVCFAFPCQQHGTSDVREAYLSQDKSDIASSLNDIGNVRRKLCVLQSKMGLRAFVAVVCCCKTHWCLRQQMSLEWSSKTYFIFRRKSC
ncbi:hypothetical protein BJX68DRAFT_240656 [Aspergillus pseudodeflectus]|uniref:Secreted protein n=1 Tax=Aspergillus pseudodeflectus TaxID=176178 RepID=A0ABR4K6L2_9EURO